MKKRITTLLLLFAAFAVVFLLSSCGIGSGTVSSSTDDAGQTITYFLNVAPDAPRSNITLSEMVYVRPDINSMYAELDDLQNDIIHGKNTGDILADYQLLREQYSHADSMLSLIYLFYAFDVTNTVNRDEYAFLQSGLSELDARMQAVSIELFESSEEAKQLARDSFGEGYVDAVMENNLYQDDMVRDLLDREEKLTLSYDNLNATFALLDNGKYWSFSDITNDVSLSNEKYYRLYDAYCAALNDKAGPIFLEQVAIRTQIASHMGYSDYATYCYDTYGRDYSPADARNLHRAVKHYITPVFIAANEVNDTSDLNAAIFDEGTFFSALSASANAFSSLLEEPVVYMLNNRLYDVAESSVKMGSSFTAYFSDYRAPFIFSSWTGDAESVATILHELGHFINYYYNASVGYFEGDNLDLAEVDAQALSLLFFDDYERFYGDLADQARTSALIDAMYSLLSGCMEDEFQQDVYENPDMTLMEMNALYARLADEYGLQQVYGYRGTEWVLISHTFQTPMYYISYAVSMVPALELFDLARCNPEGAKNAYFRIVNREQFEPLSDVLAKNGLAPVFSETTIAHLADLLNGYVT